ncbi:MAG: hypothetical protein LBT92_02710 [Rickettsiales bacterium]|nr:hypothetical protein [Rickettsiales bacterium]
MGHAKQFLPDKYCPGGHDRHSSLLAAPAGDAAPSPQLRLTVPPGQ